MRYTTRIWHIKQIVYMIFLPVVVSISFYTIIIPEVVSRSAYRTYRSRKFQIWKSEFHDIYDEANENKDNNDHSNHSSIDLKDIPSDEDIRKRHAWLRHRNRMTRRAIYSFKHQQDPARFERALDQLHSQDDKKK